MRLFERILVWSGVCVALRCGSSQVPTEQRLVAPDAPPPPADGSVHSTPDAFVADGADDAQYNAGLFNRTLIPKTRAALANGLADFERAMHIADLFEEYCIEMHSVKRERKPSYKNISKEIAESEYEVFARVFEDVFYCECSPRCPESP